ncbi:MAG: AAA family ATPase, partial [Myxococcota bacterium]
MIGPSEQLQAALATGAPEVVVSGCAGTGKTTLVETLHRPHTLCAPTNKAARRLQQVTGRVTTTVHSLIYGAPREKWVTPEGTVCRGWEDDEGVKHPAPGCPGCRCRQEIRFEPPAGLEDTSLVVV